MNMKRSIPEQLEDRTLLSGRGDIEWFRQFDPCGQFSAWVSSA
jgi:hypothetical protein